MSQKTVYEFLKKNRGRWFSNKEIAKGLSVTVSSTTNSTKKLYKSNFIHRVEKKRDGVHTLLIFKYRGGNRNESKA
jgi:DNA-binding MarR family transcriptional regulator